MRVHNHLPHINAYNHYQFITYRLSDSLPDDIIEEYKIQYKDVNDKKKNRILSVKIKSNIYNSNDYYLMTPKECVFFDNLDKAKKYLNEKYTTTNQVLKILD